MKTRFLYSTVPILLFLVTFGIAFAFSAYAQGAGQVTIEVLTSPAMWVFNGILYVVRIVVLGLVAIAGMLLTKAFALNILSTPTSVPVVPIMWAALRDLTNGVFLLVILWIALTIIFNFEQWGGKRLLARVIMVALLINFSLLMATMVFGIANQLSAIFAKNMPADPGTFIMKAIDAKNMGTVLNPAEIEKIKKEEEKRIIATQNQLKSAPVGLQNSARDTFLASIGVKTALAQEGSGFAGLLAGCGAGLVVAASGVAFAGWGLVATIPLGLALCGGGAATLGYIDYQTGWVYGLVNEATNTAVLLSGQIIFLLITAITMFYGAIVLFIRYAAMIALSVLAPLAFLAATIPPMKKYFDLWLSTLFRWAFFLPVFYIMMYLGFFIISGIDAGATKGLGPTSFDRIVIVLVGVLFMWMGLRIARQTGGAVADSVVSGVSKLGLFAAGGAAGLAMRGAGAAIAAQPERAQEWAARARRIPLVGRQIQRAMGQPMEQNRKNVEARAKEMENYSNDQLVTHFRQAKNSKEKAAAAILLARRKKTKKLDRTGEPQQAVEYTKRFGLHKDVIKENPHLATPDMFPEAKGKRMKAIMYAMKDVTDKMTLPREAYDDKETMLALISSIRGKRELEKINREAPALYTRIREVIEANKQEMEGIYNDLDAEGGVRDAGKALRKTLEEYHIAHLAGGRRRRQGRARYVVTPEEARQEEFEDRQRARENRGNQA